MGDRQREKEVTSKKAKLKTDLWDSTWLLQTHSCHRSLLTKLSPKLIHTLCCYLPKYCLPCETSASKAWYNNSIAQLFSPSGKNQGLKQNLILWFPLQLPKFYQKFKVQHPKQILSLQKKKLYIFLYINPSNESMHTCQSDGSSFLIWQIVHLTQSCHFHGMAL